MRLSLLVAVLVLLPGAVHAQDDAPRTILFLIDDLHMDFRTTPRMRDLLKRVIAGVVREGDRFGIVSTGHSSISERWTTDRDMLRRAVDRVTGGGFRPEELLAAPAAPEIRHRAHISLTTAFEAMRSLAGTVPTTRMVILITSGYLLGDDADLARELQEIVGIAREARAPVYALSPRDLFPRTVNGPDSDAWRDYVRATQASLERIARETGGMMAIDQSGVDAVLKRIGGAEDRPLRP